MKPSDDTIEQFQRIYFEEFGEEISKEQAYEKFLRLVNLLRVIIRPSSSENRNGEDRDLSSFGFDEMSKVDKLKKRR